MGLRCFHTSIFIKTSSLEGLPTKAKDDSSPHEMRLPPAGHQPNISWSRGFHIIIIITSVCLFLFCFVFCFFVWFAVFVVVGLFVDVYFEVSVVVIVLACFYVCFRIFFFLVCLFSLLKWSAVFISMWVGTGWSYNHQLVGKLTFLVLEMYINLKCGSKVWL